MLTVAAQIHGTWQLLGYQLLRSKLPQKKPLSRTHLDHAKHSPAKPLAHSLVTGCVNVTPMISLALSHPFCLLHPLLTQAPTWRCTLPDHPNLQGSPAGSLKPDTLLMC